MMSILLRRGKTLCWKNILIKSKLNIANPTCLFPMSRSTTTNYPSNTNEKDFWKPVYKFPTIKYMRFISRFKFYQMLAMAALGYPLYVQYTEHLISNYLFYSAVAGCFGASTGFLALSYFSMKVVGELCVDRNYEQIKISRLTFNGTRCEDIVDLNAVVPYMDCNVKSINESILHHLDIEHDSGEKQKYYYLLKYGHVLHEDFYKCLGIE